MNNEKGKCVHRIILASVLFAIFLSQPGCRRSGEEISAEGSTGDAKQVPSQPGDGQVSGKGAEATAGDEAPAATPSQAAQSIRQDIEKCQAQLRTISRETGALQKQIAAARRKIRVDNAEVAALVKESSDLRRELTAKIHGMGGTDEKMNERAGLQKQIQELQKQRQALVERAKEEDPEALRNEAKALDEQIRSKSESVRELSVEIEKVRREARENDPETKTLTAQLVEKEHLIEARIKADPELAALIEKQSELMADARRITQSMKKLRETMANLPAKSSPVKAGETQSGETQSVESKTGEDM